MASTSPLLEFFAQDFIRADLIAMAALGVAGLSALYARRQADEARKSRLSAEREARRPQRLEIYRELAAFTQFMTEDYNALTAEGFSPVDIASLPIGELMERMSAWVAASSDASLEAD